MIVLREELLASNGKDPKETRLELAIWLYEQRILTHRQAAHVAGMFFPDFNRILNERNIEAWDSVTSDDIINDLNTLLKVTNNQS